MMRNVINWKQYLFGFAGWSSVRSKDPSTQVGAVLVDEGNHVISTGYNGFPPGISETPERWERPEKYRRVIHAEMNAIGHASRKGIATEGATLYCTHFPCNKVGCARLVIAAGIKHIVAGQPPHGWDEDHEFAKELFDEAGVTYEFMG
jgi:dCMP deaminase